MAQPPPAAVTGGAWPDQPANPAATRIVLRPLATPLPLGFLGLFVATTLIAALQLHWVPAREAPMLGVAILVLTVPVQLVACVYGFLVRDLVAGTGMGILAGSWATVAVTELVSRPGAHDAGLGMVLTVTGFALCVPAVAALQSKVLAGSVLLGTALRFWVTAVYEWGAPHVWSTAAAAVGLALAALAVYGALAFELEDQRRETVLPTFRRGSGLEAMVGDLATQVSKANNEAGVRKQL